MPTPYIPRIFLRAAGRFVVDLAASVVEVFQIILIDIDERELAF